jgi:hypothetical protein
MRQVTSSEGRKLSWKSTYQGGSRSQSARSQEGPNVTDRPDSLSLVSRTRVDCLFLSRDVRGSRDKGSENESLMTLKL